MNYTIKVSSGPGTVGYEKMTPTQRAKQTTFAAFMLQSDALRFMEQAKKLHPTWVFTLSTRAGK